MVMTAIAASAAPSASGRLSATPSTAGGSGRAGSADVTVNHLPGGSTVRVRSSTGGGSQQIRSAPGWAYRPICGPDAAPDRAQAILQPPAAPGGSCSVVLVSESDSAVVPFDELPVLPGSGLRQAWGVWGPGDNLGTLNRLTGPGVAAAAAAGGPGGRVGLPLPLGLPDPPFLGRQRYRHSFVTM